MKIIFTLFIILLIIISNTHSQMIDRTDAIWARTAPRGTIILDGKLNESVWAVAESVQLVYGTNTNIPGSGWKSESGVAPSDPTNATLKFLVSGDSLYMAVIVKDSSVGGGMFNKFDGLLMNMRDHSSPTRPAPNFEYFYGWVTETWGCGSAGGEVGAEPCFMGWASGDRTVWNAKTTVQGISNTDAIPDTGYVMELCFNLLPRGYNATRPAGDIIEFNISIYDADWQWPFNAVKFSGNRVWWQGPWGNASHYNVARIHVRPDIAVTQAAVPKIGPELIIPNGVNHTAPTIDGQLNESVWQNAPGFDIRYGDDDLRLTYPSIGPYRSGQFQPTIGGVVAAVLDPGDVSIKYFFKDNKLYFAADIRDQVVVSDPNSDLWDGIRFTIEDRQATNADNVLSARDLIVRIGSGGAIVLDGYLPYFRDTLGGAQAALTLKGQTTVNDPGDIDDGYMVELEIDLTKLGYPAGLGDRVLFLGITLFDGDVMANPADTYGTRTWWFREAVGPAGPSWCYLDPNTIVTSVGEQNTDLIPKEFRLFGNYPNPFNPTTTIRFTMPEPGSVILKVYDLLGRNIITKDLGIFEIGINDAPFNATKLSSGVYFYKLEMSSVHSGKQYSTFYQKLLYIK